MEIVNKNINYSRYVLIFFAIFVIVDFLFYQIQTFLFGGIVVSNAVYKMLILCFYVFLMFYSPKIVTFDKFGVKSVSSITLILFIALTLVNGLRFGYSSEYMMLSFFSYDIYFAFFAFSFFNIGRGIGINKSNQILFALLFISILGGVAQSILGTDVFLKSFGSRALNSTGFFDKERLFSFYSSALVFGMALTVFVFYFFCWLESKKLTFIIFLLFISVISVSVFLIYKTYTRNVYLYFLGCMITYMFLYKKKTSPSIIKYIPYLLLGGILLGVLFVLPIIAMAGSDGFSLFYSDTAFVRFSNWNVIFDSVMSDPFNIIIGTGLVQHGENHYQEGLLIDNTFLAILYQYGILGFAFLIILFGKLWKYLFKRSLEDHRNKWILVVISPFLMAGIFNTTYYLFFMYLAFYFAMVGFSYEKK